MTDKELLELAAKAAGYDNFIGQNEILGFWLKTGKWWNPLEDDGDALRLAVKLDIGIDIARVDDVTYAHYGYSSLKTITQKYAECGGCHYSATRRAIVRAAAEIGKGME